MEFVQEPPQWSDEHPHPNQDNKRTNSEEALDWPKSKDSSQEKGQGHP